MKQIRIALVALIAALSIGIGVHANTYAASPGTVSLTQTFKDMQTVSATTNPCTGAPGTLTETDRGVFHITYFTNSDELWATFTATGTASFVPTDPNQPSYSGHETIWGGENLNRQNATSTFTLNVRVTGTDGSVITMHEVAHYTVTPSGVIYSFDKPQVTCG